MPTPSPLLTIAIGPTPILLVAPHATAPLAEAAPFVHAAAEVQTAFAAHVAEWHDAGSGEALAAAARALGATALQNALPRGLLDLNRGWRGRVEAQETLFGKGAVDRWVGDNLAQGALAQVEQRYRAAIAQIRAATEGMRGMVELHSYGELGSTYDRLAGGRPVRRAQTAVVDATPWASPRPVGLARLIPGDLRGTSWALHRQLGDALAEAGLPLGPHPYPAQAPWTLSNRFVAARWFQWLGDTGVVPPQTAATLVELAWTDEQNAALDVALTGQDDPQLVGVQPFAERITAWDHQPSALGAQFLVQTGVFATTIELRLDLVDRADAMGAAVARALQRYLAG